MSSQAYDDLYWAMGDGGPQQDILMNAQNLDTLHGKIMRVSVPRSGTGYEIPEGNVVGKLQSCVFPVVHSHRPMILFM